MAEKASDQEQDKPAAAIRLIEGHEEARDDDEGSEGGGSHHAEEGIGHYLGLSCCEPSMADELEQPELGRQISGEDRARLRSESALSIGD